MTQTLVEQAMALGNAEKAKLINLLNESMLTSEQKTIERNWAIESQKRYDDYKAGSHESVDYAMIKRN
jgi:hypothetical protein